MLNLLSVTNIFCRLPAILVIEKKGITYSQALRLNRISSNNEFSNKRCNELEKHLLVRFCSEKMVRKEIIRA